MKFFRLCDDPEAQERWFLNGLRDKFGTRFDLRCFTAGRAIEQKPMLRLPDFRDNKLREAAEPLSIGLRRSGTELDFTLGDFDAPIVSHRLAKTLDSLVGSEIQRIPVNVVGAEGKFEIINALRVTDCIDEKRSKIRWFQPGNDVRPDLAGTPEMVTELFIATEKVKGCEFFRTKGWEIALIVSERVKNALVKEQFCGPVFKLVS